MNVGDIVEITKGGLYDILIDTNQRYKYYKRYNSKKYR